LYYLSDVKETQTKISFMKITKKEIAKKTTSREVKGLGFGRQYNHTCQISMNKNFTTEHNHPCDIGRTTLHHLHNKSVGPDDNSFKVKDKRYTKRPDKPHNNGFMHNLLKGTYKKYFGNEFTYLEDSYIIYEYRLIQDKKSNFSSSKRKKIVSEFNRRFQIIKAIES
jgi:hypothetical protein